jgi:hypothetical protein
MDEQGYRPPPPIEAPPAWWRPAQVVPPVAPRELPESDHAAIDAAEYRARLVTLVVFAAALIALTVVLIVLHGRIGH